MPFFLVFFGNCDSWYLPQNKELHPGNQQGWEMHSEALNSFVGGSVISKSCVCPALFGQNFKSQAFVSSSWGIKFKEKHFTKDKLLLLNRYILQKCVYLLQERFLSLGLFLLSFAWSMNKEMIFEDQPLWPNQSNLGIVWVGFLPRVWIFLNCFLLFFSSPQFPWKCQHLPPIPWWELIFH